MTLIPAIVKVRDVNWILNGCSAILMGGFFMALGLPGLAPSLDPALEAIGLILGAVGVVCVWRSPETVIDTDRAVATIRGPLHKRTVPLKDVSYIAVQSSGTNIAMAGLAPVLHESFEVVLCLRRGDDLPTYRNLSELEAADRADWLCNITGLPVLRS
jgi:hypothetical protein